MKKSSHFPFKIYNNIAKFREEIGFSQLVLAERVGISRGNLYKIEYGQVIPSVLTALRIAKILKVPITDLFTLEETKVLTEKEKFDLYLEEIVKKSRN